MVAFVRQLCAAPFKIVLFLLRIFQQSNVPLIRLVWIIGGEAEYANMLIIALATKDLAAARQEAKTLLHKTRDARIVSTIAAFEFHVARNIEYVHQWVIEAETLQCTHSESLLLTKLYLCDRVEGYDTEHIASEMISRNDLSMQLTSLAYISLAEAYIEQQQWEQADELLDYILSIEANPKAFGLKWVTETSKGNHQKAEMFFKRYKKETPWFFAVTFEAAGHYYLNNMEKAKECLVRGIQEYGIPKEQFFFIKKELIELLDNEDIVMRA